MSIEVGSRIAHYDVIALIGEGGMGQVYQAIDTKPRCHVTLSMRMASWIVQPRFLEAIHTKRQQDV